MLCLLAVLAIGAVGASAAQAFEGPFYKVGGVRLRAFASKNIIEVKAGTAGFTLKTGAPVVEIHCAKLKAITNPETLVPSLILGSNSTNGSGSLETLKFEECTQSGNGPATCKVEAGTIETKALLNRLAYAADPPVSGTKLLVLFEPQTGTEFATIKFTGTGCTLTAIAVEPEVAGGGVCGEAWSGGAAVTAGTREPEVKVGEVNFPATAIAKAWVEDSGVLTEMKCGLVITGGKKATLEGLASFELEGKPNWGVFT
jgi:hypothetical protein